MGLIRRGINNKEKNKTINVLDPIKAANKEIYIFVEDKEVIDNQFYTKELVPIAIVILEDDEKYIISLSETEIDEKLMESVSFD